MKTQGKFLVPAAGSPFTLVIDAGCDPESRAIAFRLVGDEAKRDIRRLENGRWEAAIIVPSPDGNGNEIRCFARSRRDVESTIDDIIAMLVDPAKARALYAYFASLTRRAAEHDLASAGDLFAEDGTISNADTKSEEIQ